MEGNGEAATAQEGPRIEGGVSGIVAFALSAAVSLVSLGVALREEPPPPDVVSARAALAEAGAPAPAWLVSARHEEVLWQMGGELSLLAPWEEAPEASPWLALAHDPLLLPAPLLQGPKEAAQIARRGPWAALRVGEGAGWGLGEALPQATVELIPEAEGAPRRLCGPPRLGRWRCGDEPWSYVGDAEVVVNGARARCLWLHPTQGARLRVTWPAVEARQVLRGRVALSDEAAQTPGGAAVKWSFEVDGREVLRREQPNRKGWSAFQVDLRGHKAPTAAVSLTVSSERAARRFFCMSLDSPGRADER